MPPNLHAVAPIIRVSASTISERFYCDKLGFTKEAENRPAPPATHPAYMFVSRDGVRLHLSSFPGDGAIGCGVAIEAHDVDALHVEFVSRGVPIHIAPIDQTWGLREMVIRDPDGNRLCFRQPCK